MSISGNYSLNFFKNGSGHSKERAKAVHTFAVILDTSEPYGKLN